MPMRVGRRGWLLLSGLVVRAVRPRGAAAALLFALLAAIAVGPGSGRADTLSDCKTGAPAVAVKACTILVTAGPGTEIEFEARYYRALAHVRQADFENAEADLTVVVKANPKNANALTLRGDVHLR